MVVATDRRTGGLHLDFDLRKSIEVDSNGNITGAVESDFQRQGGQQHRSWSLHRRIRCGGVRVASGAQSFMIQGPHGRQFTVDVSWLDGVGWRRKFEHSQLEQHRAGFRLS